MSDETEETIIDAIDSSVYDNDYADKDSRKKRHAASRNKQKDNDTPSTSTLIITPEVAKSTRSQISDKRKPLKKSRLSAMAYVAIAVLVAVIACIALFLFSRYDNPEVPANQTLTTQTTDSAHVNVQSVADIYAAAIKNIESADPASAKKSMDVLRQLAVDSAYNPAMLDYAIFMVKPTRAFPDLTDKQSKLGISPDLDTSTRILHQVLVTDPANYKAAYWIYNNLMTKFENNVITNEEIKLMISSFKTFKSAISNATGDDAARYKKAMLEAGDEDTLKAWALI